MEPSPAAPLPYLLAIVALALLMTYVLVQWSRIAISLPALRLPPAGDPLRRPAVRWSLAYAAVWGALFAADIALLRQMPSADARRNLLLIFLVMGGWLAVNLILVIFIRALVRAQGGQTSRHPESVVSAGRWRPLSRGKWGRWERGSGGEVGRAEPSLDTEPRSERDIGTPRARLGNALRTILNLLLALVVIAIGEALPPLHRLHAWTQAHRQTLLAVTISMTAVGFVLLMGMAIHMVLSRGTPMSKREIDALSARRLTSRPALWRRSAYRSRGTAVGAQAEDSASFAEVKAAWRARAWQVSPRWRRLFAGLIGTALMATGMFSLFVVLGSPGIKLLCGGVLLYAWVRSVYAFARA
jgi:hypothetical protein